MASVLAFRADRRKAEVVTLPKRQPIDWSIALFWLMLAVFGSVEAGCIIFGFRAFVNWVLAKLSGGLL